MPYFSIEDFKGGLDVRRSEFTSVPGTLQSLVNAHITRGGDIEQRKAFVYKRDLPRGTIQHPEGGTSSGPQGVGLYAGTNGLVTFGSDNPSDALVPNPPPDYVFYKNVDAPGVPNIVSVDAVVQFGGKLYCAATFADGKQWHFYDGELVRDWGQGEVFKLAADQADYFTFTRQLYLAIDAESDFSATQVGDDSIDITGLPGVDFPVEVTHVGVEPGLADETISYTELVKAVAPVTGVSAVGEFRILAGANGAGNAVTAVRAYIGGTATNLITASVLFNTSPELTAFDVANAINSNTGVTGYSATARYGIVTVVASKSAGASANGRILEVGATGQCLLYSGGFAVAAGTAGAGNSCSSIKANGVEILGATVLWATSNTATAAAIAAQINTYASNPKYWAMNEGENIIISPQKVRSDDPVKIQLTVTLNGDMAGTGGDPPQIEDQYGADWDSGWTRNDDGVWQAPR
jgi:hypothetical protein